MIGEKQENLERRKRKGGGEKSALFVISRFIMIIVIAQRVCVEFQ